MLSALYGNFVSETGHPVMAVGDPSQAIYTWRGASAGTMASFHKYFPKAAGQTGTEQFSLPTTFRNDKIILAAANTISAEIKAAGGQQVVELEARNGAGDGELAYGIYENSRKPNPKQSLNTSRRCGIQKAISHLPFWFASAVRSHPLKMRYANKACLLKLSVSAV